MISRDSIISHSDAVVARRTGDEYILVPVTGNIADMNSVYTLNETGAFIWEQIDGKKTVDDIVDALVREYDASRQDAEKDVFSFIDEISGFLVIK